MRRAFLTALAILSTCGGAAGATVRSGLPRPASQSLRALSPEGHELPPQQPERLIRVPPPEPCTASRDACASRELSENLRQVEGTAPAHERGSLIVPILAGAVIVFAVFSLEVFLAGR